MKIVHSVRVKSSYQPEHNRLKVWLAALLLVAVAGAKADDATNNAAAEKPAPLPLHQIEGSGGIFSTLSAYIVNPPRDGELVGRPSVGFAYVNLGHEVKLEALTLTESPHKRLELGYGWNHLGLGDLPRALGSGYLGPDDVQLHNFNARFQIIKEGEFDQKWLPALTAGVHYKYNDSIRDIDKAVGGALTAHGISGDTGADFTLYASNLVRVEDDWWTLDAAYVVNKHLTLAVGYGHFGNVLNHEANGVWGITTKWEF